MIQLSSEQQSAADAVREWRHGARRLGPPPQVFRLFGYAGTGKTTIARELSRNESNVKFASYTGKAASVLRSKGCHDATTIHKLIYIPQDKSGHRLRSLETELAREEAGESLTAVLRKLRRSIKMERENLKRPAFALNPDSDLSKGAGLLVVDEVSMVGKRIAEDLLSFQVPILVLGDPAQLPPVGDAGFFIDAAPDFMLKEIHRQASDNPIISLATQIRQGEGISMGDIGDAVRIVKKGTLSIEEVAQFDQVIVGRNKTRLGINRQIREHLGYPDGVPVVGDRLSCLRNNHELDLLNGSQWFILAVRENGSGRYELDLEETDNGRILHNVDAFKENFEDRPDDIPHFSMRDANHFTWAYAITCHRAQGSEWPNVLVIDESRVFRKDSRKFLYTAVTRASERLTVVK